MLNRLVQWLTEFVKCAFGSKQKPSPRLARRQQVVQPPPELTNADLEFLFTELLEGVYQARGQQWALKFLQRMEHRITHDRWIEWLLSFGERLLSSPAPNNPLAERMVMLGELGVGRVGELAYDIGISLLTRNLGQGYWANNSDASAYPEEELTPSSGEVYWDEASQSTEEDSFREIVWEYEGTKNDPNSQPNVAVSLDELLLKLDQSATLVQQLASEMHRGDTGASVGPVFNDQNTEEPAQIWFYQGLHQAKIGDLTAAIASYDRAVELRPDLYEYWFNRGLTLFHLGRFLEAIESYNKALEIKPDFQQCWYNQGATLGELARFHEAIASFDQAIEIKPNYYQAWSSRGLALRKSGRLLEAINSYDRALLIEPQDHENWHFRGLALAEAGRFDDAIISYDKAIDILPDYYEAWSSKGTALYNLGRFEDAIVSYEKAIEIMPDYHDAWAGRSDALYNLEQMEEWNIDVDLAIVDLAPDREAQLEENEELLFNSEPLNEEIPLEDAESVEQSWHDWENLMDELIPDDTEVVETLTVQDDHDYDPGWFDRGIDMYGLGRLEEALICYDHAIEIGPLDYKVWYNRGVVLGQMGRSKEAIASYNQVTQIKPDFHAVWIDKGVVEMQLGLPMEAIASWDKALEIQPDFYLAWYNRGVALENLGCRKDAIASYDKAIEIQPDFHLAWYNRGVALFYLGRFEQAIASYDRALEIKLDYWEAWIGRGTAAGNAVNYEQPLSLINPIALRNPVLEWRGYEGKLASYGEGLNYVRYDTQPEGWGRLHLALANAHYEQGKRNLIRRDYWDLAVTEYNQALLTLTQENFPYLHLEIVQSQIRVLLGMDETIQAQEWLQYGTDLLQNFLQQENLSDESKKQIALKHIGLTQLAVDLAVQVGEFVSAIEIAEEGKNACFTWLIDSWSQEISSPSYEEIQQLTNERTAIIYWHLSPCALHTFICKHNTPLLLQEAAVQRSIEFEDWLKDWNQQYREYRSAETQNQLHHSFRMDMDTRLLQLKNILNVSGIEKELQGITQLILIPHRDLHAVPLHTIFDGSGAENISSQRKYTITYLPSAKIGLSATDKLLDKQEQQSLLIVEHPNSRDYPGLKFAKLESEAISQMFDKRLQIIGAQATKNEVENALSGDYSIFHFTGYGIDNFSNPQQSELALVAEEKLTLAEICQHNLTNYNLVTLSAYETAVNTNQTITSEYVGLTSGFLSQGVAHVVSTLWTVESVASALMMIYFYQRIKLGKSPAIALTEATEWLKQLTAGELKIWYEELLNKMSTEGYRIRAHLATELYKTSQAASDEQLYSHPYYWAAFTITGKEN
jgi:tetratricopeptide (TPR) repeat protein